MKLALLQTDILHPEFLEEYQGYGKMFQQMFANADIPVESEVFSVVEGVYPAAPEQFDALLVTGSKADAFADEPWIRVLTGFLQQRFHAGQKILGVCFGHQLLAHILGGKAERAPNGWGVGVMHYAWRQQPEWLSLPQKEFRLICSHRDQVSQLPPGAKLLASNSFCPNAAFYIDKRVLAFQGHPEFSDRYGKALLAKRTVDIGTSRVDAALASYQQGNDGLLIAKVMADFIRA